MTIDYSQKMFAHSLTRNKARELAHEGVNNGGDKHRLPRAPPNQSGARQEPRRGGWRRSFRVCVPLRSCAMDRVPEGTGGDGTPGFIRLAVAPILSRACKYCALSTGRVMTLLISCNAVNEYTVRLL